MKKVYTKRMLAIFVIFGFQITTSFIEAPQSWLPKWFAKRFLPKRDLSMDPRWNAQLLSIRENEVPKLSKKYEAALMGLATTRMDLGPSEEYLTTEFLQQELLFIAQPDMDGADKFWWSERAKQLKTLYLLSRDQDCLAKLNNIFAQLRAELFLSAVDARKRYEALESTATKDAKSAAITENNPFFTNEVILFIGYSIMTMGLIKASQGATDDTTPAVVHDPLVNLATLDPLSEDPSPATNEEDIKTWSSMLSDFIGELFNNPATKKWQTIIQKDQKIKSVQVSITQNPATTDVMNILIYLPSKGERSTATVGEVIKKLKQAFLYKLILPKTFNGEITNLLNSKHGGGNFRETLIEKIHTIYDSLSAFCDKFFPPAPATTAPATTATTKSWIQWLLWRRV